MILTEKEISEVLSNWKIKPTTWKKARGGNVNHNWIVKKENKKYVLRRGNNEYTKEKVEFELNYLKELKLNGFPYNIPNPIKTKTGQDYLTRREGFFWLYEFIDGSYSEKFSSNKLRGAAKMMATYHNLLEKTNLDNSKLPLKDFNRENLLKEFSDYSTNPKNDEAYEIFEKEVKVLIPILKSLDSANYNKLKKYPIHRDLNPENILWKGNKIVGVIDFDNVGGTTDAFVRDLTIFIQYACTNNRKININKSAIFLKEYKRFKDLTKEEIKLIPDLLISTYIEDFGYAYWMLLNDPERAKVYRLKLYSKMVHWYYKNRERIIRGLLEELK